VGGVLEHYRYYLAELEPAPLNDHGDLPSILNNPKLIDMQHLEQHVTAPTWQRLLSDEEAPILDLPGSSVPLPQGIRRSYDVDSVFLQVNCLSAFAGGFQWHYRPYFQRAITQDPHVPLTDHPIHKTKQLCIGQAVAGFGYECHVFFPHLPRYQENHLTDAEQRIWLDEIVIPSINEVYPADVCQHQPASWDEVDSKSRVRMESPYSTGRLTNVRGYLPEGHLEALWAAVQRRCAQVPLHDHGPLFREPSLLITNHDLKCLFKSDTVTTLQTKFQRHLARCFHLPQVRLDRSWIDYAHEDTPLDPGITLLYRTGCLQEKATDLADPRSQATRCRTTPYLWLLTRDAGSIDVTPEPANSWVSEAGVAHTKLYNTCKEPFYGPVKGSSFFDQDTLAFLALSQPQIDAIGSAAASRGAMRVVRDRTALLSAFKDTKNHVARCRQVPPHKSFGVRTEIRMRPAAFARLREEDVAGAEDREDPNRHAPFVALRTSDAFELVEVQLSRFLAPFEGLIGAASPPAAPPTATPGDLQRESLFAAIILRSLLQASSGGGLSPEQPPFHLLWQAEWSPRPRPGPVLRRRYGLDLQSQVQRFGHVVLPPAPFDWDHNPPILTGDALRHLALARHSRLLGHRRRNRLGLRITEASAIRHDLRAVLDRRSDDGLVLAAHLVVLALADDIFVALGRRFFETTEPEAHRRPREDAAVRTALAAVLEPDPAAFERNWRGRITYALVRKVCRLASRDTVPHVAESRPAKGQEVSAKSVIWSERLMGFFAGINGLAEGKTPTWDRMAFRLLTRDVLAILREPGRGDDLVAQFGDQLRALLSRRITVCPKFEKGQFSASFKVYKHSSAEARQDWEQLSPLGRMAWLVATAEPGHPDAHRWAHELNRLNGPHRRNMMRALWEGQAHQYPELTWEEFRVGPGADLIRDRVEHLCNQLDRTEFYVAAQGQKGVVIEGYTAEPLDPILLAHRERVRRLVDEGHREDESTEASDGSDEGDGGDEPGRLRSPADELDEDDVHEDFLPRRG
jgi:hypothetical protein